MNTTRRFYIDKFMYDFNHIINGKIVDLGGIRGKTRGNFEYSYIQEKNRVVINNNKKAYPDYLLSLEDKISIDRKFDIVIVNEVIEYLDNLDILFQSILNITEDRSILIMTWPWMNTFHGDVDIDFKRYSKVFIKKILKKYKFKIEFIENKKVLITSK